MEAYARAGIDLSGTVLRYAEVEQYGSQYRLLRLGSCDFDFDVAREMLHSDRSTHVTTVAEALGDVLAGSVASTVHVTLHPPGCYSFYTPLPVDTSTSARKVRLQQEAALLAGVDTPLRLTADAVYAEAFEGGGRVDWVHVLAVQEDVHARFERVLRALPQTQHRLMVSMQAAAATLAQHLRRQGVEAGDERYALAVGAHPTHVEYTLCRGLRWHFSHYAEVTAPADAAYFAVALLRQLGLRPADVDRLCVYAAGEAPADADVFSALPAVFAAPVAPLDPLALVDLDRSSLTTDFNAQSYVSCIGAAL